MSENLSKLKREKLLNSLQTINDSVIKDHPELAVQLREIYNEIETKQYGLIFEEYEESVDRILKENIAVFSEDISKRIVKGDKFNFILEGDNLASLKILEKTHYGRIGVIYIDILIA